MKRVAVLGGVALLLLGLLGATLYSQRTQAAGVKYNFTARVIITSVDEVNKSFKADVIKAVPKKATEQMEGTNREFKTGTAKVYKRVGSKDVRGTYHNFEIGQEVGVKGAAKDDDTFELTFARIHERLFTVVGLLQTFSTSAHTAKISVITSSYKPSSYVKGTEINMTYNDDTIFKNNTTAVSDTDVKANAQKVQVKGVITGSSTWEIRTFTDGYKGK